jgi:antitoxin MazE
MNAQVGKWGNGLAVRIPGTYARGLGLTERADLEVTRVHGGLLPRPRKREYRLEELIEQITPESIHGETDWGAAGGHEAW